MRDIWIPELTHPRISTNEPEIGDIHRRAKVKLDKILAEHQPQPLEETVQYELTKILTSAEQDLGI